MPENEITTCPCCGQGNLLDGAPPCPECGGRPSITKCVTGYWVTCPRCDDLARESEHIPAWGASLPGVNGDATIIEAVADWNEKAKDAPR